MSSIDLTEMLHADWVVLETLFKMRHGARRYDLARQYWGESDYD